MKMTDGERRKDWRTKAGIRRIEAHLGTQPCRAPRWQSLVDSDGVIITVACHTEQMAGF